MEFWASLVDFKATLVEKDHSLFQILISFFSQIERLVWELSLEKKVRLEGVY